MNLSYLKTKHATAKVATIILLVVTAFTATHSHLASPWMHKDLAQMCSLAQSLKEPLNFTMLPDDQIMVSLATDSCPSLVGERFFVYSLWTILFISFACLVICCVAHVDSVYELRNRDAIFHVFSATIILGGAINYMVAAVDLQHNSCTVWDKSTGKVYQHAHLCFEYFLTADKLAAGVFGIIVSITQILTACVLENSKLLGISMPAPPNPFIDEGAHGDQPISRRTSVASLGGRKIRADRRPLGSSTVTASGSASTVRPQYPPPSPSSIRPELASTV